MAVQIGDVNVYGVSGMPNDRLVQGRRYGGCAVVVRASLKCNIEPIRGDNRRLFSFIICLPCGSKIIVHNVYMPCDTDHNAENLIDYMNVLYEIDSVNAIHNDIDHVLLGGDFNTDLSRSGSLHSNALVDYCDSRSLFLCCEHERFSVDYSYVSDVTHSTSLIDHFVVSHNLMPHIRAGGVIHDGHNLSDHHPILMSLDIQSTLVPKVPRTFCPKPRWHLAGDHHLTAYRAELGHLLRTIDPPFEALACRIRHCTEHVDAINRYYDELMHACVTSAKNTIPSGRSRRIAGWNDLVKPYQEEAKYWFRIWDESGRPAQGMVSDLMRKSKTEYKRVSKWVIRNQDKLQSNKMAEALLGNRNREFWDEVKKKQSKGWAVPASVEGVQGDEAICDVFANKYDALYNSVAFDTNEMNDLLHKIDVLIDSKCSGVSETENVCYSSHLICVNDVVRAVKKIKRGKSDANVDVCSDHIVNACFELYVHLSFLFNVMVSHQVAPSNMLSSTLVPIPKDKKKSLSSSDNYRSIALSSIVGKVLDKIILMLHADILGTSNLQFGFKEAHSTTQCTFVLEEVLHYYSKGDSVVYCVLLDASKAFDRLHYVKLFQLLLKRGFCPKMCKMLISMYTQQQLSVKWNSSISAPMHCSNGVKQGGVLSPTLFCVYMDELITRLRSSKIGCHLGNMYVGALAYADDLTLLAPSIKAARRMITICEEFAVEYRVMYNPQKSMMLMGGSQVNYDNVSICLNGSPIRVVKSCKHLGVVVGESVSKINVERAAHDMIRRTNSILSNYRYCSWEVLRDLFQSFCWHAYGCPLWNLDSSAIAYFYTTWKKCCRRLLRVSPMTRSKYIAPLMSSPDLFTMLNSRFANFYLSCLNSSNEVVQYVGRLCAGSCSIVGFNVRRILHLLKVPSWSDLSNMTPCLLRSRVTSACIYKPHDLEVCIIIAIKDMLNFRDYGGLSNNDIETFLFWLCVDT